MPLTFYVLAVLSLCLLPAVCMLFRVPAFLTAFMTHASQSVCPRRSVALSTGKMRIPKPERGPPHTGAEINDFVTDFMRFYKGISS